MLVVDRDRLDSTRVCSRRRGRSRAIRGRWRGGGRLRGSRWQRTVFRGATSAGRLGRAEEPCEEPDGEEPTRRNGGPSGLGEAQLPREVGRQG